MELFERQMRRETPAELDLLQIPKHALHAQAFNVVSLHSGVHDVRSATNHQTV